MYEFVFYKEFYMLLSVKSNATKSKWLVTKMKRGADRAYSATVCSFCPLLQDDFNTRWIDVMCKRNPLNGVFFTLNAGASGNESK